MNNNPLPVIDLLNNVRVISNFLHTSQQIIIPPYIVQNYANLTSDFNNWKQDIFSEYFYGFLSENLTPPPSTMMFYYNQGFDASVTQSLAKGTIFPANGVVPRLIASADNVINLVSSGAALASQLTTIALGIQEADREQVKQLMVQVDQLNDEFQKQEEGIVSGMVGIGKDLVVTAINIGIAVGSEGGDIQPVIKSISKIGKDTIGEIKITSSASKTIVALQQAWAALDAATTALAQITLVVNQLEAVTQQNSPTMTALNNVVNEWQQVANITEISPAEWGNYGNTDFEEWCARMVTISFTTATQNVS